MKNAIYIIALLLGTTLILSAQNREPLASTKSGSQEHYNRGDYNRGSNSNSRGDYRDNSRRGNDYNHRYGNNDRRRDDGRDNRNYGGNNRHGGGHGHGHNTGHGHGHNNGHHAGHGHGHNRGHGHNASRRHGHRYVGYCKYTNHNYGWAPVSISIFNGCRQRMRGCGFESDRLREAMYFVDHHYVSSHQIADMMHFLDFESSRLEFAKYAFHRACDIQNYGVVFGELEFRSSRRELDCYIRDYHW